MGKERSYETIAADVRLAQDGNAEAMDRILQDVQDAVYYNCLRMLRDEHKAQDATQDVLIAIYQKIGTLSDRPSDWLKLFFSCAPKEGIGTGDLELV